LVGSSLERLGSNLGGLRGERGAIDRDNLSAVRVLRGGGGGNIKVHNLLRGGRLYGKGSSLVGGMAESKVPDGIEE